MSARPPDAKREPESEATFDGTTKLLQGLPQHRVQTMVRRTWQGGVMIAFGLFMVFGSFSLLMAMVIKDTELSKWAYMAFGVFVILGVILAIVGATFWSTQIVGSAMQDIGKISRDLIPFSKKEK